jgi:hypothetical protein
MFSFFFWLWVFLVKSICLWGETCNSESVYKVIEPEGILDFFNAFWVFLSQAWVLLAFFFWMSGLWELCTVNFVKNWQSYKLMIVYRRMDHLNLLFFNFFQFLHFNHQSIFSHFFSI